MVTVAANHLFLLLTATGLVKRHLVGLIYTAEEGELAVSTHCVLLDLLPYLEVLR